MLAFCIRACWEASLLLEIVGLNLEVLYFLHMQRYVLFLSHNCLEMIIGYASLLWSKQNIYCSTLIHHYNTILSSLAFISNKFAYVMLILSWMTCSCIWHQWRTRTDTVKALISGATFMELIVSEHQIN